VPTPGVERRRRTMWHDANADGPDLSRHEQTCLAKWSFLPGQVAAAR
jgi:hypothetical protein